ncbi:putative ammonia monooxygenase [Sulfitobacter guttiformis KCTC 32187]|nr:putative ammonia monooxygenase [Sulfitobacter guttiformis KCTC 32187]
MIAQALGVPIPFLIGSLFTSAAVSLTYYARTQNRLWFPLLLRKAFIAVIGIKIGSTFTSDVLAEAPSLLITLTAMVVFIALAQAINYAVFRHIGRYDKVTALYSAMPGGLIEAVSLGEKAGGDVEMLSVQHFVRVILVIIAVPALFLIFTGQSVGSADGQIMQTVRSDWKDWAIIAILVPIGIFLGQQLRLPAAHLVGPLLLTAALQGTGAIDLHGPAELLNIAQLIVGAGLGTMFARSTMRRLAAAMGLGMISVAITLGLSAVFAAVLARWVAMPFGVLLISFAPGGVTEMSLVALSLGVSPVLVTAHHLFRIVFTVTVAGALSRQKH